MLCQDAPPLSIDAADGGAPQQPERLHPPEGSTVTRTPNKPSPEPGAGADGTEAPLTIEIPSTTEELSADDLVAILDRATNPTVPIETFYRLLDQVVQAEQNLAGDHAPHQAATRPEKDAPAATGP